MEAFCRKVNGSGVKKTEWLDVVQIKVILFYVDQSCSGRTANKVILWVTGNMLLNLYFLRPKLYVTYEHTHQQPFSFMYLLYYDLSQQA